MKFESEERHVIETQRDGGHRDGGKVEDRNRSLSCREAILPILLFQKNKNMMSRVASRQDKKFFRTEIFRYPFLVQTQP